MVAAAFTGAIAAGQQPGHDSPAAHFPALSPSSLMSRLAPIPPTLPEGLAIRRHYRWSPEMQAVVVEADLVGAGAAEVTVAEVPLLDLRATRMAEESSYTPLTYSKEQWYGSTFWTGPDWTRVGKNWHHPGEHTPSVRSFRAPRDGRATITGRVYKMHLDGDGIRASVRHNGDEVWSAEIDGADSKGQEPRVAVDLRKGDSVRFVVHKRGAIFCDTTGWDPVLTYADGEGFQASAAFGDAQAAGGWSYELLRGDGSPSQPMLRAIGPEMALRESPIRPGSRVTLTHHDCAGLAVLSAGTEPSHLAIAVGSAGPWRLAMESARDGSLRVLLAAAGPSGGFRVPPGRAVPLPPIALAACEGPWTTAIRFARRLAETRDAAAGLRATGERLHRAHQRAVAGAGRPPELDLFLLAQAEWRREDRIVEAPPDQGDRVGGPYTSSVANTAYGPAQPYAGAVADHLERARRLAAELRQGRPAGFLAAEAAELERAAAQRPRTADEWRALYVRTRFLKRQIALSNPLLNFRQILFCKRLPPNYSHLVMQYFGWRQRPGGGLFVLEDAGASLRVRDLLAGRLPTGSFLEPRLSYDGRRVLFSYVDTAGSNRDPAGYPRNEDGADEGYYHLYEAGLDGKSLRRITAGVYDDLMPEYLPNGEIVFCSTRRRGYSRCFGGQFSQRWHSYTLHRVRADGSDLRCLSLNDVNEWFPAVSNAGRILFARWDYIDRDAVTHQNLWAVRPDGTNAVAVWGNAAPKPHCTFQAKPVPNSRKIAFIASAHHSVTAGPVCLLDPDVDANSQGAIQRLTPGPYPEAESGSIPEYYESPWPLSERYFLVAYSPVPLRWEGQALNEGNALGLYLIDAAGNRELLYRDPAIGSTTPLPVRARPVPPALPDAVARDRRAAGEMVVTDIYQGLDGIPRGTVKELRVVQIFPKTTFVANSPRIGMAGEENARAILGTVPVEADGSARFTLPSGKPVLFQALDAEGFAVRTMRSLIHLQPGERTSCAGCHERPTAVVPNAGALAARRPPSPLVPGALGGRPFSFVEVVQPVLDRQCVRCHGGATPAGGLDLAGTPHNGFTRSYWSLCGTPEEFSGGRTNPQVAAAALVPRFGMRNRVEVTPVGGLYGARGSRLMKLLRAGHQGASLTDDEVRRLAAWIDLNALFYGAYAPADQARQLAGEVLPMPAIQ